MATHAAARDDGFTGVVNARPGDAAPNGASRWTDRFEERDPRGGGRLVTALLIAVIAGGAAVRGIGVLWGLPLLLHPDEWVIVEGAIDLAQRNSFEPRSFSRPDHLEIQLSYLAYQAWSHLALGLPPEVAFAVSPAQFYGISRSITVAFGTAMIPLAYLIGREHSRWAGLFAAAGVAFFGPFIEHSRLATPDIPLTFTVLLVILGCTVYLRTGGWWPLLLACLGVAAGITVKYPAVVGTVVIAATVIVQALRSRSPMRILSRGASAAALVLGMTFLLSPVLFTNASEVVYQLSAQNLNTHLGASGLGVFGNAVFYAQTMVTTGGVILCVFAVCGLAWIVLTRWWMAVPLGIGLVYWVVLSSLSLHWDRWGLPIYATVVILGGIGVRALWSAAGSLPRRQSVGRAVVAALASLSAASLVAAAGAHVAHSVAPDTRSVASAGLADRGADPANTAFDGYTPFLLDEPGSVASRLVLEGEALVPRDAAEQLDFVLTSSTMADRYLADPSRQPEHDVYRAVDALPVIHRWDSLGAPPRSALAVVQIAESLGFVLQVLQGRTTGPTLTLYELESK